MATAAGRAVIVWTDDTDAAYAELVASGATGLRPPHRWLDRLQIAWIADPDGNPIRIVPSLPSDKGDPTQVKGV